MKRRSVILYLAMVVSLGLHALLAWQVMGIELRVDARDSLFVSRAAAAAEVEPMRVSRAVRDLIVDDSAPADPAAPLTPDASEVRDDSERLIEQVDPKRLVPPEPNPVNPDELAAPKDVDPSPPPPDAEAPSPGESRPLNLAPALLAIAKPSIALPQYKAATDTVHVPDASFKVDPKAQLDLTKLDLASISKGLPGGTGVIGDGAGGSGAAAVRPILPPPPLPDTPRAPAGDPLARITLPPIALPRPVIPAREGDQPAKPTIHLDADFDYELFVFDAPPEKAGFLGLDQRPSTEPSYFEVRVTPKRSLRRLAPLKKDVVYMIDTSESIDPNWVAAVKRGVVTAMDSLDGGDRFNIVLFKDSVSVLAPDAPLDITDANRAAAQQFINSADSSGFTDVNRALAKLMVRSLPTDRVYQIVLISDGRPTRGALDARTIINMITRENDLLAGIYCVGAGEIQDRTLLEFLAYRNKGFAVYPETWQTAPAKLREVAGRLRYPVLKDVVYDVIGAEHAQMYPRAPRDVYQGEAFSIFGRIDKNPAGRLSVRLTGGNGDQPADFTVTLPFDQAKPGSEATMKAWAFWKLHHLYAEIIRRGKTDALQKQIDEIRQKYDLKTAY